MFNVGGFTPVHLAAAQDNVKISLLYIRHGAHLMVSNREGKMPGDLVEDLQLKMTFFGLRTSYSHPLPIVYIDLSFFNVKKLGSLGICMCPGRKYKEWSRDIFLDLQALVQAKCHTLISVITRKELSEMGLNDFIDCVRNIGLESYQISIATNWLPNSVDDFKQLSSIAVSRLIEGKNVIIHCDSGKSRSSLFAGSILVQLGLTPEKAKILLRGISEEYLNNPAHVIYLSQLKFSTLDLNNLANRHQVMTELESDTSEKEETVQDTQPNT
jgi:protein-tyrosine phosphatase